jgi:hypothetical protein
VTLLACIGVASVLWALYVVLFWTGRQGFMLLHKRQAVLAGRERAVEDDGLPR